MAENGQEAPSPFITSWQGKASVNSVEFLESFKKYDKDSKTVYLFNFFVLVSMSSLLSFVP